MNKGLNVKFFVLLITCTAFILLLSQLGLSAYTAVFKGNQLVYSSGTMIGPILIEKMTREEAETELKKRIQEWSKTSSFSLQYQEETTELPGHIAEIKIKESLDRIQDGRITDLTVEIDSTLVSDAINRLIAKEEIRKDIDMDKIEEALLEAVQQFQVEPVQLQVLSFLKTDGDTANTELSVSIMKGIGSEYNNIETIITNLEEIEIGANETFSLLNSLNNYGVDSEALSIVASGIYRAILPTNFMITERNIGKQLPVYSELGYEAKISDKMDLIFHNPNAYSYKLTFELAKDVLQVKLIGPPFLYKYSVRIESQSFKPKTVVQFSAKQTPTTTKVIDNGKNALLAKVFREAKDDNNLVVETTLISEDFYPPVHRVEVWGLFPPESNSKGSTNVNDNEELHEVELDSSYEDFNDNYNELAE